MSVGWWSFFGVSEKVFRILAKSQHTQRKLSHILNYCPSKFINKQKGEKVRIKVILFVTINGQTLTVQTVSLSISSQIFLPAWYMGAFLMQTWLPTVISLLDGFEALLEGLGFFFWCFELDFFLLVYFSKSFLRWAKGNTPHQ